MEVVVRKAKSKFAFKNSRLGNKPRIKTQLVSKKNKNRIISKIFFGGILEF